jgi:hypothetical protein
VIEDRGREESWPDEGAVGAQEGPVDQDVGRRVGVAREVEEEEQRARERDERRRGQALRRIEMFAPEGGIDDCQERGAHEEGKENVAPAREAEHVGCGGCQDATLQRVARDPRREGGVGELRVEGAVVDAVKSRRDVDHCDSDEDGRAQRGGPSPPQPRLHPRDQDFQPAQGAIERPGLGGDERTRRRLHPQACTFDRSRLPSMRSMPARAIPLPRVRS